MENVRFYLCLGELYLYRELYQSFLTIVLRHICVSIIPQYYADQTLILMAARRKAQDNASGSSLILLFQSAGQTWSFLCVPWCENIQEVLFCSILV